MSGTLLLVLVVGAAVAVLVITVVVRFERACLQELADTPDAQLAYFSRQGWQLLIVFFIPLGGMLFLFRGRT